MLLALPQTLLVGDIIIQKTAFTLKRDVTRALPAKGRVFMNGHIRGYVNGVLDGEFQGIIDGEMGAVVRPRDLVRMEGESTIRDEDEGPSAEETATEGTESEVADHEE